MIRLTLERAEYDNALALLAVCWTMPALGALEMIVRHLGYREMPS